MSGRLEVRRLSVAFAGRAAVDRLDLELAPGEVLGLVGPSGSGKSQAVRAIIGLSSPDARVCGEVRLDGRDLLAGGERAFQAVRGVRLGLVFQEPATALDPVAPIGAQVAGGLRRAGRSRRAARAEALQWLARVGLDPARAPPERRAHQLSGGQRQRVAIAAAAALGPAILMADEPTTALDPATQAEVMGVLAALAREDGMGLLLVSHDLALVAGLADRLVVLDEGRAVAAGSVAEVLSSDAPQIQALKAAARPTRLAPAFARIAEPPILSARGLRRLYRTPGQAAAGAGVQAADLDLHRGEALAVIGATGSGKSTLLRLLLGLEPPDAGAVRLGGEVFSPLPEARRRALRRRIQPVFQDPAASFDPRWSAARIVAEPLGLLAPPLPSAEIKRRMAEALTRVGLSPADADRPARAFSGGQRQRLALARALVVGPDVLVLDEATSALDTATRAAVLQLLADLKAREGLACLIVTHDLAVVRALADRVAVLDGGRIVEQGSAADILAAPSHPATRALVAASPTLDAVLAARFGEPQKA